MTQYNKGLDLIKGLGILLIVTRSFCTFSTGLADSFIYLRRMAISLMYIQQPIHITLNYMGNFKVPSFLISAILLLSVIADDVFKRNVIAQKYLLDQPK